MPLPKIQIRKLKDGREVASFRDTQGRVRTRNGPLNWTRAEQIRDLADYAMLCQLQQMDACLGSDGQPMKALNPLYALWKSKVGLRPQRDLLGLGGIVVVTRAGKKRHLRSASGMAGRGHMRDDIRINYLDDRRATFAITTQASRIKARANEQRSPWWGWSPASLAKIRARAAQIFGTGIAEQFFELGLIGASALAFVKARVLRRVA